MIFKPLNFGKHKNETLPQIVFVDLDYFVGSYNKFIFKNKLFKIESDYIYHRIQNIKIPKENYNDFEVEYYIQQPTGKFGGFKIVEKTTPLDEGSSLAFRSNVIDLTILKTINNYDKLGSLMMIGCLKNYYFGDKSYKMTKIKCEDFINNDSNFLLELNQ
jgi:hypothetical protein